MFSTYFGGKSDPSDQAAHILGAVDDLEMAAGFEKSRVAGADESIRGFGFRGLLIVLVIADKDSRRAIEDLAVFIDADFDLRGRASYRVGANFTVRVHRHVDRGLGLTVELLQVYADRAIELKELRPNGLARCVPDLDLGKAEAIAQRRVNQDIADPVERTIENPDAAITVQDPFATRLARPRK